MIITIGRKPFVGSAIDNVQSNGCAAINIDSCRIKFETDGERKTTKRTPRDDDAVWSDKNSGMKKENSLYADADPRGRFPANFILQTETVTTLDEQSGLLKSGALSSKQYEKNNENNRSLFFGEGQTFKHKGYEANEGGASRYFKVIK